MSIARRILLELAVGLSGSGAVGRRETDSPEVRSRTVVEVQRHEYEESLQLLNEMRRVGGVRRVGRGAGDNGAPIGQISERVLRHTDFEALNDHIQNGTEFADTDAKTPYWGQYAPGTAPAPISEHQRISDAASREQKLRAVAEVHEPKHVRTLQDELFGR